MSTPDPSSPAAARRTSGRSAMSGLGLVAVKIAEKRSQSTSATVTVVSPDSTACRSAATARSGRRAGSPVRRSTSSCSPPAHGPQATESPVRPRERRCSASASRKALPAA